MADQLQDSSINKTRHSTCTITEREKKINSSQISKKNNEYISRLCTSYRTFEHVSRFGGGLEGHWIQVIKKRVVRDVVKCMCSYFFWHLSSSLAYIILSFSVDFPRSC